MARAYGVAVGLAALLLAGCMTEGGGTYQSYPSSPTRSSSSAYRPPADDSPSIHNTSGGAREALKAGCRERYPTDNRKYRACTEGDRHSEEALAVGCSKRYPGNGEKIRRCLSGN